MLQSVSSVFVVYRRKTLTGSPDPTHANGTDKPCMCEMCEKKIIFSQVLDLGLTGE